MPADTLFSRRRGSIQGPCCARFGVRSNPRRSHAMRAGRLKAEVMGKLPAPSLPDRLAVRPEGELQFEAPASWYLPGRTVRRWRALREERT